MHASLGMRSVMVLVFLVAGIVGSAGASTVSAQSTDDPTVEATADPRKLPVEEATAEPSGSDDRDSRKLPTEEAATPDAGNDADTGEPDLADFAELGLVDQGQYVSPQFGTEVSWDETYAFDPSLDEPIQSDTQGETDSLTLVWNGDDFILLYIDLYASDGYTPADFEELWASEDYLADTADPDAEVLLQDSNRATGSVLIRDYLSDGEEILLLRQAISLDRGDTVAIVTLIGLPDSFSDAYADAGEGVTVEGEPALDVFTPREIDRAQ